MKSLKGKIAAVFMAASIGMTAFPVTAFAQSQLITETVRVEYDASVAKPTYSIKGTPGKRKIKLKCSTSGATIYYTTDGSKPTAKSNKYTGLITITKNTKIRAIAIKGSNKSSVMTKTVKIATLLGDATGNGVVDESDYTRYKNYRAGKTTYICKDNCDMDGSGGLSKKDLELLRMYIDGEIEDPEDLENALFVAKPDITVYKAYGGKRFLLECETKGATIYYTTDGSTPNKNDNKYTGKFIVDEDTTVKAVAYKDGSYSDVKTRTVTVDKCDKPYADKDTSKEYQDSVTVKLDCDTEDARILYTTNGTDPLKYGYLYKEPIVLEQNTTLKVASECKGYANSDIATYEYKVKSSKYTISGRVWDDSYLGASDGRYQNGEAGINGITVMLLNTQTNKYDFTTTTATINGVTGAYVFDKANPNSKYKVVFQFNGQKYRPYPSVVSNGNQAVLTAAVPEIAIKNGGAYSNTGKLLVAVNSYSSAIVSAYYNSTYATTNSVYSSATQNVDLALQSDIFGHTAIEFTKTDITSAETGRTAPAVANQKAFANDVMTYTLKAENKSETQALKSGEIMFYMSNDLSIQSIKLSNGSTATYSYQSDNNKFSGMTAYLIKLPELATKSSCEFTVTAKVNPGVKNARAIVCYAEMVSYTYKNSCYDKFSIPGNFNGYDSEADDAISVKVLGYESLTDSQTISWASGNDFASDVLVGNSKVYKFNVKNGISTDDFNVYVSDNSVLSYIASCTPTSTGTECILVVTGKKAGSANIVITLSRDSSKLIDANVTVANLPAVQ